MLKLVPHKIIFSTFHPRLTSKTSLAYKIRRVGSLLFHVAALRLVKFGCSVVAVHVQLPCRVVFCHASGDAAKKIVCWPFSIILSNNLTFLFFCKWFVLRTDYLNLNLLLLVFKMKLLVKLLVTGFLCFSLISNGKYTKFLYTVWFSSLICPLLRRPEVHSRQGRWTRRRSWCR